MAATARVVDLTNVKEGGNFRPKRKPAGDYKAKIVKADDHQPADKSKPLGWVLTVQVEGDARSTYPYYLSPDPKQAWKIGAICRAAGLNVRNSKIKFDANKLVGKAIGVALDDDEYEGRLKSVIDDVFPVSEVGPSADEDAPDEVEDIDTDEVVDDTEEEYEEDEPEEEPEPTPPVRKRRAPKPAPEPEPEEDEEYEDEEEPEPVPPPRKRAVRPAAKQAAAPAPRRRKPAPPPVEDDDDLDDLDTDDLDG